MFGKRLEGIAEDINCGSYLHAVLCIEALAWSQGSRLIIFIPILLQECLFTVYTLHDRQNSERDWRIGPTVRGMPIIAQENRVSSIIDYKENSFLYYTAICIEISVMKLCKA